MVFFVLLTKQMFHQSQNPELSEGLHNLYRIFRSIKETVEEARVLTAPGFVYIARSNLWKQQPHLISLIPEIPV